MVQDNEKSKWTEQPLDTCSKPRISFATSEEIFSTKSSWTPLSETLVPRSKSAEMKLFTSHKNANYMHQMTTALMYVKDQKRLWVFSKKRKKGAYT